MYFFKKKIQLLFKNLAYIFFKFLYGKINCNSSLNDKIKIELLKKDHKVYKLIQIKKGRIYTDYVENVAIINKNSIVADISYQQIKGELKDVTKNVVLKKGTPRLKKNYVGNVFSLVQGASGNNYFHWLFDILPRLLILEKNFKIEDIEYFYLPDLRPWQLKSLSVFNIDKTKLINSKKNRHIVADNVIATSHPWYEKGYVLNEAKNLPKWIIDEINLKYNKFAQKFDCNPNFFIDRRESQYSHCQIINDEEIKEFLIKKNFSVYKVGELSFFEQIYLFQNAKTIIGAHGAAFANLVFCNPGAKIVEIIPKDHPNNVDQIISNYRGLKFNFIKTNKLKDDKKINGDIYLPIKEIEKFI